MTREDRYHDYYAAGTWGDASYHLTINSSVLGLEGTANYICSLLENSKKVATNLANKVGWKKYNN